MRSRPTTRAVRSLSVVACVPIAVWLCVAAAARAQAPELSWQTPPGCPSRDAWLAELSARVDPEVFRAQAAKLRVALRIEPTQAGYSLTLSTELEGARGERRIEAAACGELTHAAALIVALALDPRGAASSPPVELAAAAAPAAAPAPAPSRSPMPDVAPVLEPEPAPARSPDPPPAPAGRADSDSERPQRTRAPSAERVLLFARPLAALDLGVLPQLALGASLQAGARLGATSLEVGGTYLPTQSVSVEDRTAAVGELRFLAASLGVCHGLSSGRIELAPCVRAEYGRIWGRGRNLERGTFAGGASWLALLVAAKASFEVAEPLALVLELGGGAPLLAAEFGVEGLGQAHDTPAVFGRLSAGAELAF